MNVGHKCMIQTNCKKCGAELFLREGYCVCNNCGEIYALVEEEEIEEVSVEEEIEAIIEEEPAVSEVEESVISETQEEIEETEEKIEEEPEEVEPEEIEETTEEEKVCPPVAETVKKKKSKAPAVIWILVLIVAMVFAGYFVASHLVINTNTDTEVFEKEEYAKETLPEEEPEEIPEEVLPEEVEELKEELKEEAKEEPKPVPAKKPVQDKKPAVMEPPVVSETPAIAYRIRKSANDSDTQIGAFADIERAKSFAAAHAGDGYKVYDLNGNLIYQP